MKAGSMTEAGISSKANSEINHLFDVEWHKNAENERAPAC
jgi:hypothetical protein